MRKSYGEGVVNHTGPESCGDSVNAVTEALTGVSYWLNRAAIL